MNMILLLELLTPFFGIIFAYVITGWFYGFGPVIWVRKAAGRRRARLTTSRQELVRRVQELVPQASDSNVVFSVEAETSTSGGSKVQVTTSTYHYHVFVADAHCIWILPFFYEKSAGAYDLGTPVALTRELIADVELSGKPAKKLEVTFRLKPAVGLDKVVMVLEPFQFKKNRHYPFDFFQETACAQAFSAAEKLALLACGRNTLDLEQTRIRSVCENYAISAGMCGFLAMAGASGGFLIPTLVFLAVALLLLVLVLARGRIPKLSVIVVLLEAFVCYRFLR